jgi:hypothetical protein
MLNDLMWEPSRQMVRVAVQALIGTPRLPLNASVPAVATPRCRNRGPRAAWLVGRNCRPPVSFHHFGSGIVLHDGGNDA